MPPALPEIGVPLQAMASALLVGLGAIVSVVVGGIVAFALVWSACVWVSGIHRWHERRKREAFIEFIRRGGPGQLD